MKCLYLKPLLDFHNGCNNPSNNANYRLFGLGELYNVKAPYNKVNNRKQLDVLGFSGLRHLNKVLNSPCTVIRQVLCLTTIKPWSTVKLCIWIRPHLSYITAKPVKPYYESIKNQHSIFMSLIVSVPSYAWVMQIGV